MTDKATPAKVRLTDGLGAFLTAAMMKNATMSELAEARARSGYCPKCQAQSLQHCYSDGIVFCQCDECGTVAVLGA